MTHEDTRYDAQPLYENDDYDALAEQEFQPENPLPAYLVSPLDSPSHTYGELSYQARQKAWVIKGEPSVCQAAKRIFPGSAGKGRGTARFPAGRRTTGDLHWLMLRYPLRIRPADEQRWQQALEAARNHALARQEALLHPLSVSPDERSFAGELLDFQKLGAGFLVQNDRTLLADEMGLGKTVQALAYMAELSLFPAIIVAPPHLVRNWQREIERFLRVEDAPPRVHVIRGLKPYALPPADIYIIHYLLLRGWKTELPRAGFQAVIFDEIQELRHAGTEKYSAASLLADACPRVAGLSGTPIYNRGGEIFHVMNIIDFHSLGDWESFSREWCVGFGGDIVQKPQMLGEHLRREGLILRRVKDQVLDQLPPKRRAVQPIDADDEVYARLMQPSIDLLAQYDGAETQFDRQRLLGQLGERERQATGLAKAPHVAAFVKALLEAGEKVLLFAHHHAVMDEYARLLKVYKPRFITGRETGKAKDEAVTAFMEAACDVLCISLRAASGLNLQRATCVVFGELDWSPAVHSQAEDRAHRIGQRDSVLCYYLVAPKGSDQDMVEALGLKISQFVGLMGDAQPIPEEEERLAQEARDRVLQAILERARREWKGE